MGKSITTKYFRTQQDKKQWEDKNDDKRDVFWVIIPYFYNLFSEKASII